MSEDMSVTMSIWEYEKVYEYTSNLDSINPHNVKPLYVKGITGLNDK